MSHISKATANARRQVMIARLGEAFAHAKDRASNADMAAQMIEADLANAGFKIIKTSASAGAPRGVVRSVDDPAAGEGLR